MFLFRCSLIVAGFSLLFVCFLLFVVLFAVCCLQVSDACSMFAVGCLVLEFCVC